MTDKLKTKVERALRLLRSIEAMQRHLDTHPDGKNAEHFRGSAWQWMWYRMHSDDMRLDGFKAARDGIVKLTDEDYRGWFGRNFFNG